jgi:uncharacterized protein (DUF1697 family)
MEALRAQFEAMGLAKAETFIASGNVIFDTRSRDLAALERKIEVQLKSAFGFEIHTFVRTAKELAAITEHSAFDEQSAAGASTYVVGFMSTEPGVAGLDTIARLNSDIDRFHIDRRELYWLSQAKQSESTFSNAVFEKALGIRATFRGMPTLRKLVAKLG